MELLKSKLKATGIHLGISFGIFLVLFGIILFWWYPGVWFSIDGGWQGTRIMLLVDMVLGPMLTFMIFNPKKSRRDKIFDFSCIAIVQCLALGWGIYAVHKQRPLAIAFWGNSFYSVDLETLQRSESDTEDLDKFGRLPALVFVPVASSPQEEIQSILDELNKGISKFEQSAYYEPLQDHIDSVFEHSLKPESTELPDHIRSLLNASNGELAIIPFNGRYENHNLIIDRNGKVLGHYQ